MTTQNHELPPHVYLINRYRVSFTRKGKTYHVGTFDTIDEASIASKALQRALEYADSLEATLEATLESNESADDDIFGGVFSVSV